MAIQVYRRGKRFVPPAWEGTGAAVRLKTVPQRLYGRIIDLSRAMQRLFPRLDDALGGAENEEDLSKAVADGSADKNAALAAACELIDAASDLLPEVICGLEGVEDEDNKPVQWDPEHAVELIDLIDPVPRFQIFNEIIFGSSITRGDLKNSESGSSSEPASSADGTASNAEGTRTTESVEAATIQPKNPS